MSGGVLARMRADLSIGAALAPAGRQRRGSGSPGAWHVRAAWATMPGWLVMTAGPRCCGWAMPVLDGARPSGVLGWVSPVAPVVTQAAVGPGTGPPGAGSGPWPRGRALLATGWWRGAWARKRRPRPRRAEHEQNIQRLQRDLLREPGTKAPATAGTQTPAARRLARHLARSRPSGRVPQYGLATTVVGMVLSVRWGLRHPRRLTVLAIANEASAVVFSSCGWPGPCSGAGRGPPPVGPGRGRIGSPAAGSIGRTAPVTAGRSGHPATEHRENRGRHLFVHGITRVRFSGRWRPGSR